MQRRSAIVNLTWLEGVLGLPESEAQDIVKFGEVTGFDHPVGLIEDQKAQSLNLTRQFVVLLGIKIPLDPNIAQCTHLLQDIPQPTRRRDQDIHTTR